MAPDLLTYAVLRLRGTGPQALEAAELLLPGVLGLGNAGCTSGQLFPEITPPPVSPTARWTDESIRGKLYFRSFTVVALEGTSDEGRRLRCARFPRDAIPQPHARSADDSSGLVHPRPASLDLGPQR